MKILTLNTWQERGPWQARWDVTLAELTALLPDFVCFQELFNREWALELQKRACFNTLLFPKGPSGLVIYSRWPAKSWGEVELPKSPLEEYRRYALWSEFERGGAEFFLVNTHLSWKSEDSQSRLKQADALLNLLKKKAGGKEVVIAGDLNATPPSPEIRRLTWDGKCIDIFHRLHQLEEKFTWDNRNPYAAGSEHKMPDRRVDFILTQNAGRLFGNPVFCDLVFTKPGENGVFASDHFGMLAEFK